MQKVIDYVFSLSLSDIGSWASVVGIFINFLAVTILFRIKKKFLFRTAIDDHINRLTDISSDVAALLRAYSDNQKDIEEFFALANVELRAMQRGSSEDLLSDIKNARKLIRRYRSSLFFWVEKNEGLAREIKTSLSVVSAELGHHKRSFIVGN